MDPLWKTALWQQFGATIDMLENALLACPDTHWSGLLWKESGDHPQPEEYATFWRITYHTLFWLDLYLTGSWEGFAPPAPFTLAQGVLPNHPYSRDELHTYLVHLRKKCQTTIAELSDERAHEQVDFTRSMGKPVSFLELLLYSMRHMQEHATQLNLFLGQNGISEVSDWVSQASDFGNGEERRSPQ